MKTDFGSFDSRYFLSVYETCDLVGLSRSFLYRKEMRGEFSKKVLLSPMRKGYRKSDVDRWMEGVK